MKGNLRYIAVGMAFLGTIGMSGCGNNNHGLDPKNPETLILWHYYNGAQKSQFDALVTEFNETVGAQMAIYVEAYSQSTVSDLSQKVLDAIQGKVGAQEMPDIFAAYSDTALEVNNLGMLADIGQYLTDEEEELYVSSYVEEGKIDDEGLKIFPIAKSTEALFINETAWETFASQTGAQITDLSTCEGITKVAQAYYEWTDAQTPEPDDGKAFYGRDALANYILVGCQQLGAPLTVVENGVLKDVNVQTDVMRKIWDNYYVPYINGYFVSYGRFASDDTKTGDIIAYVGATSGATFFPSEVTSDQGVNAIEGRVYPLPDFEGTEPYAVQQGAGMTVIKSNETREYAATVFLKWFTQEENNIAFAVNSGYLPVLKSSNNMDKVKENITVNEADLAYRTLEVGINMVNNRHLYMTMPFDGGSDFRETVNTALKDKALADREKVLEAMTQGMSRTEAVALYDTEENFEEWLTAFEKQLMSYIK